MSVGYQDNFKIGAPKPIDSRFGFDDLNTGAYRLYSNTTEAKTQISVNFRHQGLTVGIDNSGKTEEWWWRDGTADNQLVLKTLGGTVAGAKNGLTVDTTDNYVKLGGSLLENTTVDLTDKTLKLKATSGSFITGIEILPGAANANPVPTASPNTDRVGITGNLSVSGQSYFAGNIGMGARPFLPTDNTDIRLNIFKEGLPNSTKSVVGSLSSATELTNAGVYTGSPTSYVGSASRINFSFNGTGAQALNNSSSYTGALSYFQFATGRNVTGGVCSAHAAQAQFAKASLGGPSGTLDRVITYRAMPPVADSLIGYAGTVAETVGLQIESQNSISGGGAVTKSYGIKQLGSSDVNLINGKTGMGFEPGTGSIRLFVYNQVDPRNIAGTGSVTTNSEVYLLNTSGALTTNISSMAGLNGGVALSGSRVTQDVNFGFSYMTGLRGGVYFAPSASIDGTLCSVTASSTFQREAINGSIPTTPTNLTTYIAFRATSPSIPDPTGTLPDPAWYGTIFNCIGLLIENFRTDINGSSGRGSITNSYGIVQGDIGDANLGEQDTNIFNAEKNIFRNLPTSSAGLPSGALWRDGVLVKVVL